MSRNIDKKIVGGSEIGTLANNIRMLMHQLNVDSNQLSDKTGIALTTINALKRGVGNPTLSTLHQLSEFFEVTIGDLTEKELTHNNTLAHTVYEIPLLNMDDLASFLKNGRYKHTISTELDSCETNKYYATKLTNNSMNPLFEKGSIFVIARRIQIHDGDIVLVKFNDHPPCFRKVFIEGKTYFFKTISELIGGNLIKDIRFTIYGVVVKAIQHFHNY